MGSHPIAQDIFRAIGFTYVVFVMGALVLAIKWPKTRLHKGAAVCAVLGLMVVWPAVSMVQDQKRLRAQQAEYQRKYQAAKAHFDERCKGAGEKIYRTVEGVQGITLAKLRPNDLNYGDQFKMDDPYGQQAPRGKRQIQYFLNGELNLLWEPWTKLVGAFRFVDVLENGQTVRYEAIRKNPSDMKAGSVLQTQTVATPSPYVVSTADESTRQDREHWVACGSITVTHQPTAEVLGKRLGCMFDEGLGSTGGGRAPWHMAHRTQCPAATRVASNQTPDDYGSQSRFVAGVLKNK
jgi:hypothetical protein